MGQAKVELFVVLLCGVLSNALIDSSTPKPSVNSTSQPEYQHQPPPEHHKAPYVIINQGNPQAAEQRLVENYGHQPHRDDNADGGNSASEPRRPSANPNRQPEFRSWFIQNRNAPLNSGDQLLDRGAPTNVGNDGERRRRLLPTPVTNRQPQDGSHIPEQQSGSPEHNDTQTSRPLSTRRPPPSTPRPRRRQEFAPAAEELRRTSGEADSVLQSQRRPPAQGQDEYSFKPYSFNYVAESDEGLMSREEAGDANGRVTGSYSMTLEDGRRRTVDYLADELGFRANIQTNEPGTSAEENPADVLYSVNPANVRPHRQPFGGTSNTVGNMEASQESTSRTRSRDSYAHQNQEFRGEEQGSQPLFFQRPGSDQRNIRTSRQDQRATNRAQPVGDRRDGSMNNRGRQPDSDDEQYQTRQQFQPSRDVNNVYGRRDDQGTNMNIPVPDRPTYGEGRDQIDRSRGNEGSPNPERRYRYGQPPQTYYPEGNFDLRIRPVPRTIYGNPNMQYGNEIPRRPVQNNPETSPFQGNPNNRQLGDPRRGNTRGIMNPQGGVNRNFDVNTPFATRGPERGVPSMQPESGVTRGNIGPRPERPSSPPATPQGFRPSRYVPRAYGGYNPNNANDFTNNNPDGGILVSRDLLLTPRAVYDENSNRTPFTRDQDNEIRPTVQDVPPVQNPRRYAPGTIASPNNAPRVIPRRGNVGYVPDESVRRQRGVSDQGAHNYDMHQYHDAAPYYYQHNNGRYWFHRY